MFLFSDLMNLRSVTQFPSLVTLLLVHTSLGRLSNILWQSDVWIVNSILVRLGGRVFSQGSIDGKQRCTQNTKNLCPWCDTSYDAFRG